MEDAGGGRWWRLGLAAAVLLVVGSGWYQALTVPPYYANDEQAHAGYVLELEAGRLPTIDTPIDAARGGPDLRQQVDRSRERQRDVWVANNPPAAYLVAVPPTVVARALGLPGGPLLGVRLANVAAFGAAAVVVGRLGRRLAGGDVRVGLVAAAAFAAVPHVGASAGTGFIDGLALLAALGAIDTVTAITVAGPTRRQVLTLAGWVTLAAGVRPMAAVVGAGAAALALGTIAHRSLRGPGTAEDGSSRVPGTVKEVAQAGLVLGVPPVVLSGWWYVRNHRLYGDPTGSDALFAKFGRVAPPDAWRNLLGTAPWAGPARTLLTRRSAQDVPDASLLSWDVARVGGVLVLLVATGLVVADQVRARRAGSSPPTPLLAWLGAAGLGLVATVLVGQHWAGGGNIHPRYLFLPLALLAVAAALVLVRLGTRWAGLTLVGLLLAQQAVQVPRQNRSLPRPGWALLEPGHPLTQPIGPTWVRYAGIAVMAVGVLALVVALLRTRPTPGDDRGPTPGDGTTVGV